MTINYDFSGFSASVTGYEIDTSKGTKGFEAKTTGVAPYLGSEFYIWLKEKPYNDTQATPAWRITDNTSLLDQSTGKYPLSAITTVMIPSDTAVPRIAYTLALPGQARVFYHFSEPIYGASAAILDAPDFTSPAADSLSRVTITGDGTSEALATYPVAPTLSSIAAVTPYAVAAALNDAVAVPHDYSTDAEYLTLGRSLPAPYSDRPGASHAGTASWALDWPNPIASTTHRVSALLVSAPPSSTTASDYPPYFVWPVWAKDSRTVSLSEDEIEALTAGASASTGIGLIRAFDGTQWLRDQDITVQARENSALGGAALTLHYDTSPASTYVSDYGLWLPSLDESAFSGLVPYPDGLTVGVAENGGSSGALRNTTVDSSNAKIVSGKSFEFFYTVAGYPSSGAPLYCARLDMTAGATVPDNWYRLIKPFSFQIHDVRSQKGSVTILNNVIDPTKGETVRLSYQIPSEGAVTVTVFTLDGDVVRRLYSGTEAAGDYSTSWDGRNMGGASVARGIYFVRVIGPGVDEMRKVMVVRK